MIRGVMLKFYRSKFNPLFFFITCAFVPFTFAAPSIYDTQITFVNQQLTPEQQKEFSELLLSVSEAVRLSEKPISSDLIIKKRAGNDLEVFKKALNSRGYYDARLSYELQTDPAKKLIYQVDPGSAYRFESIKLENLSANFYPQALEDIKKELISAIADARKIRHFEEQLLLYYQQEGYPFIQLKDKKYYIDRIKKTLSVQLFYETNSIVYLDDVSFEGHESVRHDFLTDFIKWDKTKPYHPDQVQTTFQSLLDTQLFSQVKIQLKQEDGKKENEIFRVPVDISLTERKHRTLKASAGFETDTGVFVGGTWTHRNLLGAGEKLQTTLELNSQGPLFDASYRQPTFMGKPLEFLSEFNINSKDTEAYESQSMSLFAGVDKHWNKNWMSTLGLGYRFSQITDDLGEKQYHLIYPVLETDWHTHDDLFEPTRGGKLYLQMIPYYELSQGEPFLKFLAQYSHYLSIFRDYPRMVLASRVAVASIFSNSLDIIPDDLRLYAGGGGSIRGISSQMASPLNYKNNPVGGRRLLEMSLETRFRFNETMGAVAFLDMGSAFSDNFFDGSADIIYGTGLGFRYSSPIGPLRADIAIPVNKRKDIDDAFQIYLSIGHAF